MALDVVAVDLITRFCIVTIWSKTKSRQATPQYRVSNGKRLPITAAINREDESWSK